MIAHAAAESMAESTCHSFTSLGNSRSHNSISAGYNNVGSQSLRFRGRYEENGYERCNETIVLFSTRIVSLSSKGDNPLHNLSEKFSFLSPWVNLKMTRHFHPGCRVRFIQFNEAHAPRTKGTTYCLYL